ncbi:MAG: hypothetical protein A2505_09140 [Deltaproteobacteria bacterium RIFOXYD12_FULL_55_16]|nr:MAG: hypothetical protein A2505_09140 [Deltaproteobacteria bacterium RIFOXYD12_FULL_55_16]
MKFEVTHKILTMEPNLAKSAAHVLRFLDHTPLVQYDTVRVEAAQSCSGADQRFWPWVEQGLADNRQVLTKLIGELQMAGTREFSDLLTIPQGFQSKIFHTMAHLLDGFFGIDSQFYNLPEDSHWLGDSLRRQIEADPEDFWLVTVVATLEAKEHHALAGLRSFEK